MNGWRSKRGRVDLLLNLDLLSEFFFHQTPLRVVQANFWYHTQYIGSSWSISYFDTTFPIISYKTLKIWLKKMIKLTKPPYPHKFSSFTLKLPVKKFHLIFVLNGRLMICRFLEKINCDRFYNFQCPTPFKRQRRDVGRVKRTIIPEAFSYNSSVPFAPLLHKQSITWSNNYVRCVEGKHNNKIN